MPIYAYRCATCGHAKDVLQKMSDPVLTLCPACGASTFEKQVTAAGFQLKGSGWYVTDFRDKPKQPAGDAAKPGAGAAEAAGAAGAAGEGAAPAPAAASGGTAPAASAPAAGSAPAASSAPASGSSSPAPAPSGNAK